MHVVLVDNGRSERLGMAEFWYSLKCIRCGACMNTCPVYRRSGGLSYGATYSGPIGVIIDPTFNLRKYSNLPFASTLNGSCTNVCPVKINIHEQIYKWRRIIAERHQLPFVKKEAMRVAGDVLASPKLYRAAVRAAGTGIDTSAALHDLQPPQRLGPPARSAGGAAADVPAVVPEESRGRQVTSRDDDFGARAAQPAGARAAARRSRRSIATCRSLLATFTAALTRMGGVLAEPPERQLARQLHLRALPVGARDLFGNARGARHTEHRVGGPADGAGRRRRRRRARGLRRRRDRLGVAERARVRASTRSVSCRSISSSCSIRRRSCRTCTTRIAIAASSTARYAVLMTGPSATADIEGVLVRGAQGIRTLTVIPVPALPSTTLSFKEGRTP